MDRQDDGQRGARPRHRFEREDVADVVLAGAAPGGGDGHPHQAQLAAAPDQIAGELVVFVDARGHRSDLGVRERLDACAEVPLGGRRLEEHGG